MDDEGDPDEIERHAAAWDDREDFSESETETEKTAARAVAHPEVAIRRGLSEAQQRCAEEALDRIARLRRVGKLWALIAADAAADPAVLKARAVLIRLTSCSQKPCD